MAMLAKPAAGLRSGNRYGELVSDGCPDDLASLCVRPMVWTREYPQGKLGNSYLYSWVEGQDPITDLVEWIEYVPSGVNIVDCSVCCGIPEDTCMIHGIPAAFLRDAACDCCGLDIAFCVYRESNNAR